MPHFAGCGIRQRSQRHSASRQLMPSCLRSSAGSDVKNASGKTRFLLGDCQRNSRMRSCIRRPRVVMRYNPSRAARVQSTASCPRVPRVRIPSRLTTSPARTHAISGMRAVVARRSSHVQENARMGTSGSTWGPHKKRKYGYHCVWTFRHVLNDPKIQN